MRKQLHSLFKPSDPVAAHLAAAHSHRAGTSACRAAAACRTPHSRPHHPGGGRAGRHCPLDDLQALRAQHCSVDQGVGIGFQLAAAAARDRMAAVRDLRAQHCCVVQCAALRASAALDACCGARCMSPPAPPTQMESCTTWLLQPCYSQDAIKTRLCAARGTCQ